MNLVNPYRFLAKSLVLAAGIAIGAAGSAQNLNNPNKLGPIGTQVNTLTGNFYFKRTDLYIPARALDIRIAFSYNSFNFPQPGPYGKGWSFEYDIYYRSDTLPGGKIIVWGDGREDTYDSIAPGTFRTPKGYFSVLTQYQPGKYKLRQKNGIQYLFENPAHGKLTRIEEPNGNFISFNYTDTLLTSLTNAAGQSVSFNYNQGKLATVTENFASPARTFSYFYDVAGNLKEVMDPLGGRIKYTYLINGPMKTLTDKNGNLVDIIYYPDFTASELIGCNKRISFSYDTTSQTTIVTDYVESGNQVTKYKYQKLDGIAWISSMSGNCCGFNVSYEYNSRGNPLKMTDANGNVYEYTYDTLGNALTVKDPLGQESHYAYSADFNKITSYTDPKGNVYSITYDIKGNLIQIQAPGNLTYTATYAPNGDILTSTDPKGNTYIYQYDAWGNPATVAGPNGYNAELSFDARGRLLSVTDARGNQASAEYDILNRLKKITDPLNQVVQLNYDAQGNPVSFLNQANEATQFNYDASNRLVKVTGPTGNQSFFSYDAMDNLRSIKNPLGYITTFSYDNRNRLVEMKDPESNGTRYEYDHNGNITRVTMANGREIQLTYDALDRLISASDQTGILGTLAYDKNNNVISLTNGTGAVTTAVYDSLNRVRQITDPLGNITQFVYDANDNVVTMTDREGHSSHYTYDSLDRVKTYTDNNGFVITVSYDAMGNVTQLKDQNNNTTDYTYDSLNRRKRMTFADGTYREYHYDNKGNLTSARLTDGGVIVFNYDTLNRIISRTLPGGEIYTYTYDKLNRILTATNNNGTVSYTYDALDRVTSESFDGRTIQYTYNITGRTQSTTYPDGSEVVKEFDLRNRLVRVMRDSVVLASYVYNNANQLTEKTVGNGVKSILQYDVSNRLSGIITGGGLIQSTIFTYDKVGNKTTIARNNEPALSEQFVYDNGYRLVNYKRGPAGSPLIQNTYTYDAVGNRVAANLNGVATTYTVNNLNQLTGVNGTNFSFDGRGNLTYDGTFHKKYDAENRLLVDSTSPANVVRYGYDALNRRVLKQLPGITYRYTHSGLLAIEEREGGSGAVLNSTVYSSFLRPVAIDKEADRFFYHSNELGSVEALTNQAGRTVERYQYDVYGKLSRFDSLGNLLPATLTGNRFGFTGQEYDSASGSYRFFYRNYSPETGVFNQRDLIEYADGMGMYQYVGNNPANGLDVYGLCGMYDSPNPKLGPQMQDVNEPVDWAASFDQTISKGLSTTNFFIGLADKEFGKVEDAIGRKATSMIKEGAEMVTEMKSDIRALHKSGDRWVKAFGGTQKTKEFFYEASNQIAEKAKQVKAGAAELGQKVSKVGDALGVTELAYKGGKIPYELSNGISPYWEKEWYAVGDFATSGLTFLTGEFGAVVGNFDFVTENVGGKSFFQMANDYAYNEMTHYYHRDQLSDAKERWASQPLGPPLECYSGGLNKPKLLGGDNATIGNADIVRSSDPNEIIGPEGQPDVHWVSVKDRMPYTILCENAKVATAPARYIYISTPIEPKQDPTTIELGTFGLNNQQFNIPPGLSSYYQRVDCRDSMGLFVDVVAGYNQFDNEIFWTFQGIDPVTLLPPDDPMKGILFLQDSTQPNYGHGYVTFSIKPRADAQTLDTIGARAKIVFDTNDTIPTNIYTNTIDAVPPTSQMNAIGGSGTNPVTLSWSGSDDPGGCGIDYYTVYVSTDLTNYSVLFPRIRRTDTTIVLPVETNYCFFVLATDRVGNTETLRPGVIQCATIGNPLPVTWLYFTGTNQGVNNLLKWATGSEQNSREFIVERSLTGSDFSAIGSVPAAGNSTITRHYDYTDPNIDRLGSSVMFYRLKQTDLDGSFRYSNIVRLNYNRNGSTPSIVYPNPTTGLVHVLVGDKDLVGTEAVVTDMNGRVLQRLKITAQSQSIDLSAMPNGLYLVRLENKEILKVVKQ